MYLRKLMEPDLFICHLDDLDKIDTHPTYEETIELFERYRAGEEDVKNQLWTRNMGLSIHLARLYTDHGMPYIDLINEGYIGLEKAIEKFDHTRGIKFSSYASTAIKRRIESALMKKSHLIRKPPNKHEEYKKYLNTRANLTNEFNRQPSIAELANMMGETPEYISSLKEQFRFTNSIDNKIDENDPNSLNIGHDVSDESQNVEMITERNYNKKKVKELLLTLKTRNRHAIELKYGLIDGIERTLDEVGEIIGITRQGVQQRIKKGFAQIKEKPMGIELIFE